MQLYEPSQSVNISQRKLAHVSSNLGRNVENMAKNLQSNSTLIKSARAYYHTSKSKPRTKFNSVASYDRGTLYERAIKRQQVNKLKMESAAEREERELA